MVPAGFSVKSSIGDLNPDLSIANVLFYQAIEIPVSGLILGLGTLSLILKNSPVLVGPFGYQNQHKLYKDQRRKVN
jgi:hypothetical protein